MLLNILRWIVLIPAVYVITTLLFAALMRVAVAFERLGGPRVGLALRLVFTIVAYFCFGAVLVLVAEWIAPSQQKLVGLLAALFSIIEAWRRCYIYAHFTRMAYPNAIATALGSIIAAYNS
jgi:hypothetical protein